MERAEDRSMVVADFELNAWKLTGMWYSDCAVGIRELGSWYDLMVVDDLVPVSERL